MKVALGTFARTGVEAVFAPDVAAGVSDVLLRYADGDSAAPPPAFPRFRRDRPPRPPAGGLEVSLDPDAWRALERGARCEQPGPSPEQLAVHAVLVHLAELDRSGVEVLPAPLRS